MDIIDLSQECC